jgi:hypothetical protein
VILPFQPPKWLGIQAVPYAQLEMGLIIPIFRFCLAQFLLLFLLITDGHKIAKATKRTKLEKRVLTEEV